MRCQAISVAITLHLAGCFLWIFITIKITFSFGQKMDCAGCSKFAINFRIAACEAFFAHVYIVLHAGITGFCVRMIQAASQIEISVLGPRKQINPQSCLSFCPPSALHQKSHIDNMLPLARLEGELKSGAIYAYLFPRP